MPAVLFAQSVFGYVFAMRTLRVFRERALIPHAHLTKIGTGMIASGCVGVFFLAHDARLALIFECVRLISFVILLTLMEHARRARLREEIPGFIDRWILNLRLGFAPSTARERALQTTPDEFVLLLNAWLVRGGVKTPTPAFLLPSALMSEVQDITLNPNSALRRLEYLRADLSKQSEFRRKSGQSVHQSAVQAVVMLILLFALSFLAVHHHGWHGSADFLRPAWSLAGAGTLLMLFLARKRRWTL